jgi:hypothetical protein
VLTDIILSMAGTLTKPLTGLAYFTQDLSLGVLKQVKFRLGLQDNLCHQKHQHRKQKRMRQTSTSWLIKRYNPWTECEHWILQWKLQCLKTQLMLPPISKTPPDFVPTGRFTEEQMKMLDIDKNTHLWPKEKKSFKHILALNKKASARGDDEPGIF